MSINIHNYIEYNLYIYYSNELDNDSLKRFQTSLKFYHDEIVSTLYIISVNIILLQYNNIMNMYMINTILMFVNI